MSPGTPFVRQLWAGGKVDFNFQSSPRLRMCGLRAVCYERIRDFGIKGPKGQEKYFVTVERRISGSRRMRGSTMKRYFEDTSKMDEDGIREHLSNDKNCAVIEERNLVFMRERTAAEAAMAPDKIVKPPHEPTFSQVIVPTPELLFRFSALTFNAHRIHLDLQYCKEVEGYRNLLVHGPLTLVLMVELLRRHLATGERFIHRTGERSIARYGITDVEYRNLAPLYCGEPLRICGRDRGDGHWDLWIEGKDGGYAVKGVAKTLDLNPSERLDQEGDAINRITIQPRVDREGSTDTVKP